jgi:hypothetical protein
MAKRRLLINVQADRLPDLSDATIQIGLRISASIQPNSGDPDVNDEKERVLPWRWKDAANAGDLWNPHSATAWTIWRAATSAFTGSIANDVLTVTAVASGTLLPDTAITGDKVPAGTRIITQLSGTAGGNGQYRLSIGGQKVTSEDMTGLIVKPVPDDACTFVDVPQHVDPDDRLSGRINEGISVAIAEAGAAALERPTDGQVTGRKVFALVESLTMLPAPVPAHFKVWTCVTIDTSMLVDPDYDKDNLFLAAPRFGLDGFSWAAQASPRPAGRPFDTYAVDLTATGAASPWKAETHPTLPLSRLMRPNGSLQLIEPATLWIYKRQGQEFEPRDWTPALQNRIAEAIDPAARTIAVAYTAIRNELLKESANGETSMRDALRADLMTGGADILRKVLTALHGPILWPNRLRSNAVSAPALAFLAGACERDPALWTDVIRLQLALVDQSISIDTDLPGTAARDRADIIASLPAPDPDAVVALSRGGLLALAGVPPGSDSSRTGQPDHLDPAETAVLEQETGFLRFVVWHWTNATSRFPDRPRRIGTVSVGWKFDTTGLAQVEGVWDSILDLRRLPEGVYPIRFRFDWNDGDIKKGSAIAIANSGREVVCSVSSTLTSFGLKIDYTVDGSNGTLAVIPTADGHKRSASLELKLTLTRGNGEPAAGVTITASGSNVVSSGQLQLSGRVFAGGLDFQLGAATGSASMVSTSVVADISASVRDRLVDRLKEARAPALRGALALAAAGPAIPWLLAGRSAFTGAPRDESAESAPLAIRLPVAVKSTVTHTFDDAFEQASSMLGPGAPIQQLINAIRDAAKQDASSLADRLLPASPELPASSDPGSRRVADRLIRDGLVTENAQPLVFAIDQLQDFGDDDLWSRLAGLGVLIGRSGPDVDPKGPNPPDPDNSWWSLNVATLHAPSDRSKGTLDGTNAVQVRIPAAGLDWHDSARVDPVPYQVSEIGGVRDAVIRYESQSIVAQMWSAATVDQPASAPTLPRRPEAYFFPRPIEKGSNKYLFPRLPPLTFGRWYHIAPYLMGHGGVLPLELRQDPNVPADRKPYLDSDLIRGGQIEVKTDKRPPRDVFRSKQTLRTRPVGAPRLADNGLPATPQDVAPLAAELPIRLAFVTLRPATPSHWFLDKTLERGVIERPRESGAKNRTAGVRVEIGVVTPSNGRVTLRVFDANSPGYDRLCAECSIDGPFGAATGLRLDFLDGAQEADVSALVSTDDEYAENEPRVDSIAGQIAGNALIHDPSTWTSAFIEIEVDQSIDLEPPRIAYVVRYDDERTKPVRLDSDRMILPPEAAHQTRRISVLDAIRLQPRSWPDGTTIRVCRPAVDLGTYDGWINGPLSGFGSADPDKIGHAIDDAHERTKTITGKADRTLDDPAVEGLAIEVVQIFPVRKPAVDLQLLTRLQSANVDDRLGTANSLRHGTAWVTLNVQSSSGPMPPWQFPPVPPGATANPLILSTGCVYELRFYAAIPATQDLLAKGETLYRLTRSASSGWRSLIDEKGQAWHLGAPLTLTFEITTEEMPELFSRKPIFVSLDRSATADRDAAIIRLDPGVIANPRPVAEQRDARFNYPSIRYVDRMALMKQRWSWRGRPHPGLPVEDLEQLGFDGEADTEIAQFVETAFIDRADDDIGEIRETRVARAHSYAGRAKITDQAPGQDDLNVFKAKVPVFLQQDLAYRAGAHLWRYAVRATSRYTALRPNDSRLMRFSHTKPGAPDSDWHALVVPDRPGSRRPKRPGVALVLPLTEPLMINGAVPPLLALFNDTMYPQFHAGDGIESVVEVARHPLPTIDRVVADDWADQPVERLFTSSPTLSTSPGKNTLHFASVPASIVPGATVQDATSPGAIAAGVTVLSRTATTVDISADVSGGGVSAGDAIVFSLTPQPPNNLQQINRKAIGEAWNAANHNPDDPTFQLKLARGIAWGEVQRIEDDYTSAWNAWHNETDVGRKKRLREIVDWWTDAFDSAYRRAKALDTASTAPHTDFADLSFLKFLPEHGFDPIRTAEAADGSPLAIRSDGPVGYTFDPETEAGRFDHAGLLVSPVASNATPVRPWSMLKLMFRRLENPEFLRRLSDGASLAQHIAVPRADGTRQSVSFEKVVRLSREWDGSDPGSDTIANTVIFPVVHEGIVLDVPDLLPDTPATIRTTFSPADQRFTSVTASVSKQDGTLTITGETELGKAGSWILPNVPADAQVSLRLVISQRPKPGDAAEYRQTGDASIRVRLTRDSDTDVLAHPAQNSWLSVLCMPLAGPKRKASDKTPVSIRMTGSVPDDSVLRPVRLSDFTPGVWCQFAAAMSRFEADVTTSPGKTTLSVQVNVTDMAIRAKQDSLSLALALNEAGGTITSVTLRPEGGPHPDSQLEEKLYAVVTRYVTDAFDRLRERPMAVYALDSNTLVLTNKALRVWPFDNVDDLNPFAGKRGRLRFLRILWGKNQKNGGFVVPAVNEVERFRMLFGVVNDPAAALETNPPDAIGMALGISRPLEWTVATAAAARGTA